MRQWRAGTFSMGLILVLFGFALLFSTLKGAQGVKFIVDLWPVALIVLGGEIIIELSSLF